MEKFFSRMFAACVAAAAAMASPASAEEVPARFSVVQWNIGNFSMGTNSLTAITDGESAARSAEYRAMIDALKPEFLGISEFAPEFDKAGTVSSVEFAGVTVFKSQGADDHGSLNRLKECE